MSILAPNYTQIPNIIIDEWLDKLSGLQLKILIIICRKTIGWHKLTDRISLSQLMEITKAARDKICDAIKALVAFGLIIKEVIGRGRNAKTYYEINIKKEINSSQKLLSNGSQKLPTKETYTKEKERVPHSPKLPEEDLGPTSLSNRKIYEMRRIAVRDTLLPLLKEHGIEFDISKDHVVIGIHTYALRRKTLKTKSFKSLFLDCNILLREKGVSLPKPQNFEALVDDPA